MSINQWKNDIVETNRTLTEVIVKQLNESSRDVIDSLVNENFFRVGNPSVADMNKMDRRLKIISTAVLSHARGMEGGFFFRDFDEFYGYAFPTSPPPIPAFGPPPRSYNIIKNQVMETIDSARSMVELHKFDPAIFPLATEPIIINGESIGALWARIHIERELPTLRLRQVINIGAVISLLGFIIAVFISVSQRKKILRIHEDLEIVKTGVAHEVTEYRGSLGYIGRSINMMVKALGEEHRRREQLERELHQKEKMASLGKLIAGVAHEVKTPLAIIKTRIQMWQQNILSNKTVGDPKNGVTEESLKLVVREIDRLSDLVRRLLFFSKPKSENLRKTNINDLLHHTILLLETRGGKFDVKIETDFDPELPDILLDSNAVEQVFINIINNSREAISGSGLVQIKTEYERKAGVVRILIRDNGTGIPDNILQNVFDPFFTTKDKGFGLGLSISYEIIKAHGGKIRFFSTEEQGTLCTIEIPITTGHQEKENDKK